MASVPQQNAPTDRLIIGFAGRIGSGKTTAAQYLVRTNQFRYLRYSQVLAEWRLTDPADKNRLQEVGWQVMDHGFQHELNTRLIALIEPGQNYAVDGLRHPIDYDSLRKQFGKSFHLLFIDCPLETRWQRTKDRFPSFEAFVAADSKPVENHIPALQKMAEIRLDDSGPETFLFEALEKAVGQFQRGKQT